ncbi:MAG: GNAT family N-acetyltransferase [Candidatus Symbiothrix sp.]|jgi:predicted GNAT family N-acyltransferase|nr:GNAT family N-acetyltransferase [Candidatus Symbiothrix sp.]
MKLFITRDTKSPVYLDAVRIRRQVFVEEQHVPTEIEIDAYEALCVHFVLYDDETDAALATARLLPGKENENLITLQRMAVLKEYRGNGYGRKVMEAIEKFAAQNRFPEIVLHAQLTAKDFYTKMGYIPFGDEFEEAGIRHISMKRQIQICAETD